MRVRGVNKKAGLTDKNLAEDINIVDAAYASEVDWEKEVDTYIAAMKQEAESIQDSEMVKQLLLG